MGLIAIGLLVLQTLTLPYRNDLPGGAVLLHGTTNFPAGDASPKTVTVHDIPFSNASNLIYSSKLQTEAFDIMEEEIEHNREEKGKERDMTNDRSSDNEFSSEQVLDLDKDSIKVHIKVQDGSSRQEKDRAREKGFSMANKQAREMLSKADNTVLLQRGSATSKNSTVSNKPIVKKMRCDMPPKTIMTISEMNHLFLRKRASSPKMRPEWSSIRDHELVSARSQIINAPIVRNDRELYAPLFRNVSMFKRSYELMEQILKVYVYKEGKPPIFHLPILKGLYASEGWFMKLMVGNKKFVVKDPKKAHLFYMPFSTRMLEHALYVRNSHNRTNLALYLKNYANMLASKYPFWNRTSGADHFFVACHDWAPYETRHHMERCVKAMCNADVTQGFKIGKDVSLPETYVRSARNPLRDIGGKNPSDRSVLAFFAGNMHGYLRPILLQHWENKDPDMKIFGPMPPGVASKMNYIQHMKSSKYCICAKGYEVNSPRVVEAIFYECVPVIISDNFVPPFFEVLNWEAFSVIVAEKDIPKLKDILLSIPEEKYRAMQLGVKKVQRHFLWHRNPVKYDLFYMTLHSIWYNRVFQIKPR
ncbi:Exostosin-like [Macleaya cordata]|uniref:Exostosin-like n=1 Tax=Macleaya cordata TaxID=56857 RepID=A0A200RC63_MACCD|nr:Exostosin-like [Macleaya cordata]